MAKASVPVSDKSVQILTYHGRTFVTGLLWHPLGSLNGYMREARQFGRHEKMDIVAIRHTESIIQAGFVARSAGAVKGMYSLAASLAGQLGSSWYAAWRLNTTEEKYALVAVYEGAVIPGYDLVGTADEIKRKVGQLRARSIVFDRTYLPEQFDREAEHLDIEALLSPANLRREFQLRPLAFGLSPNELMRFAAICGVLICCLIGWQQWSAHKAELARKAAIAAEQQRQAALAELNQRAKETQTVQALEHPWAKLPSARDFIDGCSVALNEVPLGIMGWPFATLTCNGTQISATFKRVGNATSEDFIRAVKGHIPSDVRFNADGNEANLDLPLELPLAGDGALEEAATALSQMRSWLNAQNLSPTFTELADKAPQPVALPGQPPQPPSPQPDWKHYELKFTTTLPPITTLREGPNTGLRLREIKTDVQGEQLSWTVTGDLYAK